MEKIIISISVVSHGQMDLIAFLMQDIQTYCRDMAVELILTLNTCLDFEPDFVEFSYPVTVIRNSSPKGFGANHNQAFRLARGANFCILNPDIRLHCCPFLVLAELLEDTTVGAVAPLVLSPSGSIEDSIRRFPTFTKIIGKLFKKNWTVDYELRENTVNVDWVAGMFMMFSRLVFLQLEGFNERYFLYYEDVDICARINLAGLRVVVYPACHVVHHAQRHSHRSLKYLRWHTMSLFRFLGSPQYRQLKQLHRL